MKAQDPIKELTHADKAMAERYRYFRTKYVDANMSITAKKKISSQGTKVMIEEYFLNSHWLATGEGDERMMPTQDGSLISRTISELRNNVAALEGKTLTIENKWRL